MRDFNNDNDQNHQELDDSFGNSNLDMSQEDVDGAFGDASYDNKPQYKKQRYFKLEHGSNIYRIMPPMFEAKEKQIWFAYYSEHFGFVDASGKQRKFLCTRVYDDRRNLGVCLFCEDQKQKEDDKKVLEQEYAGICSQLKKMNKDDPDFQEMADQADHLELQLKELTAKIRKRNTAFWVNAMNQKNEFGFLPLKKKLYEQLVGARDKTKNFRETGLLHEIKESYGIDPLHANQGVWFNFTRSGSTFLDTVYSAKCVEEISEDEKGRKSKRIKEAPLNNQQKALAVKECGNLLTMYDYLRLTLEEQKLVLNGSPEAVTAVMNAPRRKNNYVAPAANKPAELPKTTRELDRSFGNAEVRQEVQPAYVPSAQQIRDELS